MRRTFVLLLSIICAPVLAEDITIYYDDFGIPHIYADTAEAGLYGQGWAMANDRLVQTLENYLRGMGRFSAAYGPGDKDANVRADLMSLMWDHYGISKKNYKRLPKPFRKHNQAFVDGMNSWMKDHPEGANRWKEWKHRPMRQWIRAPFRLDRGHSGRRRNRLLAADRSDRSRTESQRRTVRTAPTTAGRRHQDPEPEIQEEASREKAPLQEREEPSRSPATSRIATPEGVPV